MILWKLLLPCVLGLIGNFQTVNCQHGSVPIRSAPVYPDGYPAPDSRATSLISNGRISAHLEYVDRGEGVQRGDITRAGTNPQQVGTRTRTYSGRQGGETAGTSITGTGYSASGVDSAGRIHSATSGTQSGRTYDATSGGTSGGSAFDGRSTLDGTSGGTAFDARSTLDRTSSGSTSDSTSSGRTHDRTSTSDRTSSGRTYGSTSTSGRTSSGRTYGSTSTSDRTSSGPTYGSTSTSDRTSSGRTYDSTRQIHRATQRRPYDPYAGRRTTYSRQTHGASASARQPYDPRARQTAAQPDRRTGYYQQCPTDNFRILIEGTECHVAIDSLGPHVCYDDRVLRDRRCCERCLQIKNRQNPGCEYGDRTRQCSTLSPSQCYVRSNRNICCQTCERLRNPSQTNCEYGDLSPTCVQMPRRMCSLLENQRICCQTCERMRDPLRPECPYGDRSNQCGIIYGGSCYNLRVRDTCCATCARLDVGLPGCQYGDHNSVWTSPAGELDCETYTRIYGNSACADPNFKNRCCQSCRSYVPRDTQS